MTAQVPKIKTMTPWLVTSSEPVPEASLDHANTRHDSNGRGGGGTDMSQDEQEDIAQDDGTTSGWISVDERPGGQRVPGDGVLMMTEHHVGGIEMTEAEVEDHRDPEAITMAERIIEYQTRPRSRQCRARDELSARLWSTLVALRTSSTPLAACGGGTSESAQVNISHVHGLASS